VTPYPYRHALARRPRPERPGLLFLQLPLVTAKTTAVAHEQGKSPTHIHNTHTHTHTHAQRTGTHTHTHTQTHTHTHIHTHTLVITCELLLVMHSDGRFPMSKCKKLKMVTSPCKARRTGVACVRALPGKVVRRRSVDARGISTTTNKQKLGRSSVKEQKHTR